VPRVELDLGVERLRNSGFQVRVDARCKRKHFLFAGTDSERAQALIEAAWDSPEQIVWCARGGYGANHLLSYLERATAERGKPPRKTLVGFSDITPLLEFARARWGWGAVHGPVPASKWFTVLSAREWKELEATVLGERVSAKWRGKFLGSVRPVAELTGEVLGGNLAVWMILQGTPWAPSMEGKMLFLEDLAESPSRLDRMVTHLEQSGGLHGVRAILLGEFLDCVDQAPMFLKKRPSPKDQEKKLVSPGPRDRAPLRKTYAIQAALKEIFGSLSERLEIPVLAGLPMGHGRKNAPLEIGLRHVLTPSGLLRRV
jgi:muramoyltetrapeptide carboxypeptidase